MKTAAIICEYNPFHNGHEYHIMQTRNITSADCVIAIMSGNYVQRGTPAVMDKKIRTQAALLGGADLVIELPLFAACSSAPDFAIGAVSLLHKLGVIDYLSFGSECQDINKLKQIASFLIQYEEEIERGTKELMSLGHSYPKAKELYLREHLDDASLIEVLKQPNNILGIEYLKALKKYKSSIKPVCISRFATDYNSTKLSKIENSTSNCNPQNIASATAIRELIKNKNFDAIKTVIPLESSSVLMDCINSGCIVPDLNCFEKEIIYTLRKMTIEEIADIPDVSEGLEFSIKKAANSCNNINEFLDIVKSKRYTITRLQRILLYALLGISKEDMQLSKKVEKPYIRVLGFNDNGKKLVSEIATKNPELKLITSVKKFVDSNLNKNLQIIFDKDVWATDVYSLAFENNSLANLDFKNSVITFKK